MNYLRGAVNAISAPYQYYKDINPSTLTGAIDVIVISRPKLVQSDADPAEHVPSPDGEREFACSPFHVRFGKWQVLRPADKKVNVFVNGKPIPFSMKIGDAGEAFFIFETDEDIPEDIATSPLLEATKPGQTNAADPQRTGRFGAKEEGDATTPGQDTQEPDFFDLDAAPSASNGQALSADAPANVTPTPPSADTFDSPSTPGILARTAAAGKAALGIAQEAERAGKDKLKDHQVKEAIKEVQREKRSYVADSITAARNSTLTPRYFNTPEGQKGDEVLPAVAAEEVEPPDVNYGHDMVFDMEGYHAQTAHSKERSDRTITSASHRSDSPLSTPTEDITPGPSRSPSPASSSSRPSTGIPFPRATSEPPPDIEDAELPAHHHQMAPLTSRYGTSARPHAKRPSADPVLLKLNLPDPDPAQVEEYSWEWGNFPQKTPVWTAFGQSAKGGAFFEPVAEEPEVRHTAAYGSGGVLTVDRRDATRFRVFIEGRSIEFQLSLVPFKYGSRSHGHSGTLGGRDAVEDAQLFEKGKIDFATFLQSDEIVASENLVLCLEDDKYITREDGSPLMDALALWRAAALAQGGAPQASSRAASPTPFSDSEDPALLGDELRRAVRPSLSPQASTRDGGDKGGAPKPSSSSWIRWWSRRTTDAAAGGGARPELRAASSAPSEMGKKTLEKEQRGALEEKQAGLAPGRHVSRGMTAPPESAPALPSTPDFPSRPASPEPEPKEPVKRFAKTLRLTSEQLKSLELKPGANTITFSLSASGVAACTARIFVWDYTDCVVVSDIDGTITKSDALGHVFTMIGRDWTHLGVAKLYTDICRNGYKIMYLTSRAIGQADSTRDYLRGIKQNDYQLPEGPVIMSPDRLMASLHREVIMRKPEVFKMACLRDIQRLFGPLAKNPFYAGFGNRITDALSYRSVNVPSSRIFTIDSTGEVKMELLELAGYKSSYIHMTDLVDQMFPPINRQWAPEFTDLNYWKAPIPDIPLPDLAPPSPALSARSDTSNQSTLARLRHFSLGGRTATTGTLSRQSTASRTADASQAVARAAADRKDAHLRQMSSFERLSGAFAGLRGSASPGSATPASIESGDESDDEGDLEQGRGARRRERRRSVTSMPGSLPGSPGSDDERFGSEDEEEGGEDGYGYDGADEEEVGEEAFDEDLLAAGEMQSVPFL